LSSTDQNEDVDTSTENREDDIWRSLDAADLESNRLNHEQKEIKRRSDSLSRQRGQLQEEEERLRQEHGEITKKWESLMSIRDEEEDFEPSTDEEDSDEQLDDGMLLALSQRASALCSICRNFPQGTIEHIDPDQSSRLYHPTLSSLKQSVDAGCSLCEELAASVERFSLDSDPPVPQQDFWSIRCGVSEARGRSLLLRFLLCQCELGHPDAAACEHAHQLGGKQFFPARKLSLGPEFLGSSHNHDLYSSFADGILTRSHR
jgi:hypothetical protein